MGGSGAGPPRVGKADVIVFVVDAATGSPRRRRRGLTGAERARIVMRKGRQRRREPGAPDSLARRDVPDLGGTTA
jgi:hypothetical protein